MAKTELATKDANAKYSTIAEFLKKNEGAIKMALPRHMTPDRMLRVALTTIRATPDLLLCSPQSLAKCVVQCSQLGLEPDPILGQAYLVPFNNKIKVNGREEWVKEATMIIGYKGIITLARRSGEIQSVQAHVVRLADQFEYEFGLNERLRHIPADLPPSERGPITHAWALARFKDGGYQFEVMNFHELEAIRERSKAKDFGPWKTDPEPMYRKTPIRQLGKFLPLCPELARQLESEDTDGSGIDPGLVLEDGHGLQTALESPEEPKPSKASRLAGKLGEPVGAAVGNGNGSHAVGDKEAVNEMFPPSGKEPGDDGDDPDVDLPGM